MWVKVTTTTTTTTITISTSLSPQMLAFMLILLQQIVVAILTSSIGHTNFITTLSICLLSGFAICDVWYFLRLGLYSLPLVSKPRRHLFAASKVTARVGLMDIDRNGHCNNARYLRECGFGRRDLWQHNGVWQVVTAAGGNLIVGAQTVRYRREMLFGQTYTMISRLVCWDQRAFYVEHRFVTKNETADFVNAIVLVKNTVVGALSPEQIVENLPELQIGEEVNPVMPADISAWIESNNLSSKILRAEAGR